MRGHYRKKSVTTQNYEEFRILCALKTCSQNTEIEVSKVQTHNFDVSFPKISKTGDGTKQF